MSTKTIRIPMIIDAEGRWCAYGYTDADDADWNMIDEMADPEKPLVCPQRKWITATVTLPTIEEVDGVEDKP